MTASFSSPFNATDPDANRTGLAKQQYERRLKRIIGGAGILERGLAGRQHHRAVTGHQGGERRLIAARDEPFQQPRVG